MKELVFSRRASFRLEKLFDYLESEWSIKAKKDFIKKLDKAIDQIKKFPESGPQSSIKKGVHQIKITKQTTLFYKIYSKRITIITIFDNRMNPNKLYEALK